MDFLIYDLKVAALIVVFYLFYRLVLSHETFHRVNRLVLLATAVASFLLPLCVFTMHETVVMQQVPTVQVDAVQAEMMPVEAANSPWLQAAMAIYIIGVLLMLGRTMCSIWKVFMIIRKKL